MEQVFELLMAVLTVSGIWFLVSHLSIVSKVLTDISGNIKDIFDLSDSDEPVEFNLYNVTFKYETEDIFEVKYVAEDEEEVKEMFQYQYPEGLYEVTKITFLGTVYI